MRIRTVLGLVMIAPAAIAAATLTVFLGAGMLIVIAGPARPHPHPRAHVAAAPSGRTGRRAPGGVVETPIAARRRATP
jgi:hypothetical protein